MIMLTTRKVNVKCVPGSRSIQVKVGSPHPSMDLPLSNTNPTRMHDVIIKEITMREGWEVSFVIAVDRVLNLSRYSVLPSFHPV